MSTVTQKLYYINMSGNLHDEKHFNSCTTACSSALIVCHAYPCHCLISTSFLTTSRRLLQFSSPAGSAAEGTSEAPSSPPSPRGVSSQSSSNLPSPVGAVNRPGTQNWSLDTDLSSSRAATLTSVPSPSALQDTSSQDTQSSGKILAHLRVHPVEIIAKPDTICEY